MEETDEITEPVVFCAPRVTGWDAVRECLNDTDLREDFTDRIEDRMNRRQRVNIAKLVAATTKELGSRYGKLVGEVLWTAAKRTKILIEDEGGKLDVYA
jgi:hypothetical protein